MIMIMIMLMIILLLLLLLLIIIMAIVPLHARGRAEERGLGAREALELLEERDEGLCNIMQYNN